MSTTKVLSQLILQQQTTSSFEHAAMVAMPYTACGFGQKRDVIESEAYDGEAFKSLPQKGTIKTEGTVDLEVDNVSLLTYGKGIFGYSDLAVNTTTFRHDATTGHITKFSVGRKDAVSYKQYANVYIKSAKLSGQAAGNIKMSLDLLGVTPEVRAALNTYPTVTNPGEAYTFPEMSGSGFFRVGPISAALSGSNNLKISDFNFDIVTGFDAEEYNAYSIIIPEFGMVRPEVSGAFKISTHDVDTFIGYRDGMTKLQLQALIYKSSTKTITISIPNFIIDNELSDDDLVKQGITMKIGKNGYGASYENSYMAFNAPLKIDVLNG